VRLPVQKKSVIQGNKNKKQGGCLNESINRFMYMQSWEDYMNLIVVRKNSLHCPF